MHIFPHQNSALEWYMGYNKLIKIKISLNWYVIITQSMEITLEFDWICTSYVLCLVIQPCLILCNPMDCSPPVSSVHGDSPRSEYWSGLPSYPPGDLPNLGIKPRSPALQVHSLPDEASVHLMGFDNNDICPSL